RAADDLGLVPQGRVARRRAGLRRFSDAGSGGLGGAHPVLKYAHLQAVRAERLRQRDRVAVEAVEREQRPVADAAVAEGFDLQIVSDRARAACEHASATPAQANRHLGWRSKGGYQYAVQR